MNQTRITTTLVVPAVLLVCSLLLAGCSGSAGPTDSSGNETNNGGETELASEDTDASETNTGAPTQSTTELQSVQANLEFVADKIFRISWTSWDGAEFYRVLENTDGLSGFIQIGEDFSGSTQRFDHRVALYQRVNARYIVQACNESSCVDSDELIVAGTLDNAIGFFKASNAGSGDMFGSSGSLSADGTTLVIGARGESSASTGVNGNENDNSINQSGAAYVFVRNNDVWEQQAYLKASNTDEDDQFGRFLGLSADGNTLAIGAFQESSAATGINGNENDNSGAYVGAVYVFARNNGTWQQQAYLKTSNAQIEAYFGLAISLSADGNVLAVGAPAESPASEVRDVQTGKFAYRSGAAYVFTRNNGLWQQEAYLKASDPVAYGGFATSISINANGDTLAVGALPSNGARAGSVYVFTSSNGDWQQQQLIQTSALGANQSMGRSVSLDGEGNTLAVGAPSDNSGATGMNGNRHDNSAAGSGAVHLFVRENGNWTEQAYVKASNTGAGDGFGVTLSLSADGNSLAVSAPWEESASTGVNGNQNDDSLTQSGAVYVFLRTQENWQQQAYVKGKNTGEGHNFGEGFVSLSHDGSTLAVAALREGDVDPGTNNDQNETSGLFSGAVYLY